MADASTRKASRYPFAARVVLRDPGSGDATSGVTTDISEGGCGIRANEVFRRGCALQLEITRNGESMQVPSTVAYGLPPNVMGISFGEMTSEQRALLSRWLEQAVPTLRRSAPEPGLASSDHVTVSTNSANSKKP